MRPSAWITLLLLFGTAALAAPPKGAKITVRALSAKVMHKPRHIGAVAAAVARGETLVFEEAQGDWYRVTTPAGESGWIHRSHVTDSEVKLSPRPGGAGAASQDEVELAGRGFTPEVEREYRSRHGDLDFAHVDAIERVVVDPEELARFVAQGKLEGAR